jgi:hypothetical protein
MKIFKRKIFKIEGKVDLMMLQYTLFDFLDEMYDKKSDKRKEFMKIVESNEVVNYLYFVMSL